MNNKLKIKNNVKEGLEALGVKAKGVKQITRVTINRRKVTTQIASECMCSWEFR